ncbi:hypothetical protein M2451_003465 [Dysgonomonas sp. PFB1-18]|uniref:hypothetical protein n=1 Tax=unclassified Dysgonomonas TaxID=2630389 RepID=UPI00247457CD|nr:MULTISPECIES: hypothetical protein [unclassified Dysgonomonas]MDH6310616.1 hypothetical protein [Dysgonomonas sp. PF1-14]MDH6340467.1 hypothetical protein [Dysgonomonas sp. PF1-16]MDH6382125.1 hypothetical protein [Dysgonomonas sp. PFB1-18]MDH6399469.1 hypothetical protein [Dysgonomonas sp. PF1-23]
MSVLAAGGIPMIQKNNDGHIVATQSYLQKMNVGIFFKHYEDLAGQLYDKIQMEKLQNNILSNRLSFSFDFHVKDLIDFFRRVIAFKQSHKNE